VKIHRKGMADCEHASVSGADYVITTVGLVSTLENLYIQPKGGDYNISIWGSPKLEFF
jgi:hypothetical protein